MPFQYHIADHILFEDDFILVVNKPGGLMVEPDRNGNPNLLHEVKKYLASQSNEKEVYAQHIHRLDRPVSGIVLFTKQREVLRNLSEQFAERKVKKHYVALTQNAPIEMQGVLEHWHRKEKKKAVLYSEEVQWSERAKLSYKVKELAKERFCWDIDLHTGKYHQIRAQLSSLNCAIVGDFLYGSTVDFKENRIALHASQLFFYHPIDNREMMIESKADFC